MLDVLTIVAPWTPPEWLEQCRASLRVAAAAAPFPVRLLESPAVAGDIGQARRDSFALSSAPYVAWVDDDDYVTADAFSCLAPHLDAMPPVVCTLEKHLVPAGYAMKVYGRHHMTVLRRDRAAVAVAAAGPAFDRIPGAKGLPNDPVVQIPKHVYIYRQHDSAGRALRVGALP